MRRSTMSLLAAAVLALGMLSVADARAADFPSDLPLPAGASIKGRVDYADFGQEDFSHPSVKGEWEHPIVAGHSWRVFLAGEPKSLTVTAWKGALQGAGWELLRETEGNMVARHGDWWVKVGTDRLVLVQHVDAAAHTLSPPGDKPESLEPNHDVPYLAPLPGSTLKEWVSEDHFELTGKQDPQLLVLGPAVHLRYEGSASLSGLEIQARYSTALQKAGWNVVRSDVAGVTGAHYTARGRDVWVKITPSNGSYVLEVADMGAAAEQSRLASALADQGHVALYGIYFDTDKATLKPESEATLVQVQALLASHSMSLEVQGHTDNAGAPAHNQKLSEDRAASVKAWLVAHKIDGGRLTTKGYADSRPVADNKTPQGRALNRRVELARP